MTRDELEDKIIDIMVEYEPLDDSGWAPGCAAEDIVTFLVARGLIGVSGKKVLDFPGTT